MVDRCYNSYRNSCSQPVSLLNLHGTTPDSRTTRPNKLNTNPGKQAGCSKLISKLGGSPWLLKKIPMCFFTKLIAAVILSLKVVKLGIKVKVSLVL